MNKLLENCFLTMMYFYDTGIGQFTWNIQFFDSFSRKPVYQLRCNLSGKVFYRGPTSDPYEMNQEIWWWRIQGGKIVGTISMSLLDHVKRRNKR